jgi:enamine deaminase RidA (YjgF/YER057c/UK114 family)
MKKYLSYIFMGLFAIFLIPACKTQEQVRRYDNGSSAILQGVSIPAEKKLFFTSGIVAPVLDSTATDTYKRYGDTYTQSVNTLKRIEGILKNAGLGMKDVVFMRIYVAPDPNKNKSFDFDAWFKAYQVYFNNPLNPVKVARTTLGTAALARPELLIEVEAVAVY